MGCKIQALSFRESRSNLLASFFSWGPKPSEPQALRHCLEVSKLNQIHGGPVPRPSGSLRLARRLAQEAALACARECLGERLPRAPTRCSYHKHKRSLSASFLGRSPRNNWPSFAPSGIRRRWFAKCSRQAMFEVLKR